MQTLTFRKPNDLHVHFRDGEMLKTVVPYTARAFSRAIVMPNLSPPVTTAAMALAYRDRVLAAGEPALRGHDGRRCGRDRHGAAGRASGGDGREDGTP